MKFNFYCPTDGERWDWRSLESGIGGSETAVIELSRRLARRGHDVTVYALTPDSRPPDDGPCKWRHLGATQIREPGVWIICRWPAGVSEFDATPDQRIWMRCDDCDYGDDVTPERAAKIDRWLVMSESHRRHFVGKYPFLDPEKITVGGAGMASERIAVLPPENRDPFRLCYTSSPDRGVDCAIQIFQRAREFIPQLTLHVHYGWGNLDRIAGGDWRHPLTRFKKRVMALDQTNVVWEGRTSKEEYFRSLLRSSIWLYPSFFPETFCVAACEAQACGVIPICPPVWGLAHNVRHGVFIEGDPRDSLTQARYVLQLVGLISDPEFCARTREQSIPWALERFDWEKVAELHEVLAI